MVDVIAPIPDALTRPFWEAARAGRLRLQRCRECGRINHPPQPVCGWCASSDLGFDDVAPTGRIASHTSSLRRRGSEEPPFTCLVVELDVQPGVLLVGRVDGPRPDWVTIGTPVRGHHASLAGTDVALLHFTPTSAEPS